MARKASPWYWQERNVWMVTIGGQRHNLGEHPKGSPAPAKSKRTGQWNAPKAITDEFHKLMRGDRRVKSSESVAAILDDFLTWTQENRASGTYERYKEFIQSFCREAGTIGVLSLTSSHVTTWLSKQKKWNSTTKRSAITALQRGFNWAVKNRGLDRNPIRGMEKPEAKKRTVVLSPEEFEEVLSHFQDREVTTRSGKKKIMHSAFYDLLVVSYDSGCRPREVKKLEARHVQLDKQRAVIPANEAKGGIPRAVYFPTERSLEIVRRLVTENPSGPIFLNNRGRPWTGYAIKCSFARIEERVGRRINHYSLRHSFITRKLLAGVDSHVVAALSGHRDTKMIDSTYSHIAHDVEFMLREAQKERPAVRGEPKPKA